MYRSCREELLAVMRAFVIETGENELTRSEVLAEMRRKRSRYKSEVISAHLSYRCCANVPRCYKPMYDDFEKIGNGRYRVINWKEKIAEIEET